jgi:hypothetical protein
VYEFFRLLWFAHLQIIGVPELLAIAAWCFSYYMVLETKGRTLEEVEQPWRSRRKVRSEG